MTWKEVISKTTTYLDQKGVPDGGVAAESLAARLLNLGRGFLASFLDKEVTEKHLEAMKRGIARLIKGEPLQYVIGEWDFRTLTLKCDKRALIPRPETEELVTRVLKHLEAKRKGEGEEWGPAIIDVGVGTGAIILSIAKEFKGQGIFLGTDISEEAVSLARENAKLTGLDNKVKFVIGDGLDEFDEPEMFDVIVSNPPYIESLVCETLDQRVKDFEPRLALDGGEDGLKFYDRYLADALNLLKPGGAVFFEIGENQGEAVKNLAYQYGFEDIKVEKDYAGHDRYVSAILP